MTKYLSSTLTIILASCALHTEPLITYDDRDHPISDTSVFSAYDDEIPDNRILPKILSIDGKKNTCTENVGCQLWMRALPGEHEFVIRYNFYDNGLTSYKTTTINLRTNMKAKKIYIVRATISSNTLFTRVEELPDGYDYKLPLGVKGLNYKEFRARF